MIGDPQTLDYCQELIAGIDDNSNGEVDFRELVGTISVYYFISRSCWQCAIVIHAEY